MRKGGGGATNKSWLTRTSCALLPCLEAKCACVGNGINDLNDMAGEEGGQWEDESRLVMSLGNTRCAHFHLQLQPFFNTAQGVGERGG